MANALKSPNDAQSSVPLFTVIAMLIVFAASALGAAWAMPALLPGLTESLLGDKPKAYWYLSRASAFVAFGLLWVSMASGLLISNRLARVWPGGPTAFDVHQYSSLLSLAFTLFHALILLGDRYINYTLPQILLPFNSTGYEPLWVGIGQIAIYLSAIVSLTFYVRRVITHGVRRAIHFASFLLFAGAIAHGVLSGTDSGTTWAGAVYWFAGGTCLLFTVYRVLVAMFEEKNSPAT